MGRDFKHLDKGLEKIETPIDRYTHVAYRVLKGPNGRRLCKYCGAEVPPRRLVYCSSACDHKWNLMTNQSYARNCVAVRDQGICAACGVDTGQCPAARWGDKASQDARKRWLKQHGFDGWETHLWEADHIVAVVDGGHDLGLDNLQTLCVVCHKRKTAELAARRAIERKRTHHPVVEIVLDLETA